MKKNGLLVSAFLVCLSAFSQEENKVSHDFELELETEYRYFYKDGLFAEQQNHYPSLVLKPEYRVSWNKDYESINFKGFFRLDVDSERTHFDIRELYYQKAKGNWEISVGLKKVYWGVTESNHLVDIINQTDAVESFDGEKKMGQPMVQYSLNTKLGTLDLFYLPYHRKRTFAGEKGRFRFETVIAKDAISYESDAKELHQDFGARYSQNYGSFDFGLSHFYGTGREPLFQFNANGSINAFYPIINQTGLDIQATHNAFLFKLESIYRKAKVQEFYAAVGGVEYTIGNINNSGIDVGVIAEYSYDDRKELALNTLQNDLFFGSRIAFNDVQSTEVLVGVISDLEVSSKIFSIEGSRRLNASVKLEVEARILSNISANEFILSNFKKDSFLRISLFKYF